MSAHTPGPWTLRPCSRGGLLLWRGEQIGPGTHPQSSLQILPEADARLIAAAPEMYALLQRVWDAELYGAFEDKDEIRDLLARIDGKA